MRAVKITPVTGSLVDGRQRICIRNLRKHLCGTMRPQPCGPQGMFPGKENDRAFGEWVMSVNLADVHQKDREAAMWAAEKPEEFRKVRREYPRVQPGDPSGDQKWPCRIRGHLSTKKE